MKQPSTPSEQPSPSDKNERNLRRDLYELFEDAYEIRVVMPGTDKWRNLTEAEEDCLIRALRPAPLPECGTPFCWYRITRDITDEYVTVFHEEEDRPEGDGWKPLYAEPVSTSGALDTEAVKWAIDLLAIHPGVKVNTNSQMWLRRLRKVAGATEDEVLKADLDNFLDISEAASGKTQGSARPLCEHGKGLTDYCVPCGRVNGGG